MNIIKHWLFIPFVFGLAYLAYTWYKQPNFGNGAIATNFSATTLKGESIELEQFRGKIVLLYFWGSWCGPCRRSSPFLNELKQKYGNAKFKTAEGFEIIIVGIETEQERWENALSKDNLLWAHNVSSLKRFDDPIALTYGIKEIPSSFLIDEKGTIVGVNTLSSHLIELLDERVAK